MKLTRAVTHIRLLDANASKLAQLDTLASEYLHLCQQYVTAFCTAVETRKGEGTRACLESGERSKTCRLRLRNACAIW